MTDKRPWSFEEAGTSYVDEFLPDRLHLDADIAADEVANIICTHHCDEDIDGDDDAWSIVTGRLDSLLDAVNEARLRFPEMSKWLTDEWGWPEPRQPEKTPDEWCAEYGIKMFDPDGWRVGFTYGKKIYPPRDYEEPLTLHEFALRLAPSTIGGIDRMVDIWKVLKPS